MKTTWGQNDQYGTMSKNPQGTISAVSQCGATTRDPRETQKLFPPN